MESEGRPLTETDLTEALRAIHELVGDHTPSFDGMVYFTHDPRPLIDTGGVFLLRANDGVEQYVRVGRIAESIHDGYWAAQYKVISGGDQS